MGGGGYYNTHAATREAMTSLVPGCHCQFFFQHAKKNLSVETGNEARYDITVGAFKVLFFCTYIHVHV